MVKLNFFWIGYNSLYRNESGDYLTYTLILRSKQNHRQSKRHFWWASSCCNSFNYLSSPKNLIISSKILLSWLKMENSWVLPKVKSSVIFLILLMEPSLKFNAKDSKKNNPNLELASKSLSNIFNQTRK